MLKRKALFRILKEKGYKITMQRQGIIDTLLANQNKLLSVEAILNALESDCKLNITTVYRNLELLESIGIVHKTLLDNQMTYYKLSCGEHHHHHFICKKCGNIIAVEFCPMNMIYPLAQEQSFEVEDHKLEVYGVCKKCKTNQ